MAVPTAQHAAHDMQDCASALTRWAQEPAPVATAPMGGAFDVNMVPVAAVQDGECAVSLDMKAKPTPPQPAEAQAADSQPGELVSCGLAATPTMVSATSTAHFSRSDSIEMISVID